MKLFMILVPLLLPATVADSEPVATVSCAALDDPTTCTKKDWKKVHRRCSPSAKPGWGGVGHKKCAALHGHGRAALCEVQAGLLRDAAALAAAAAALATLLAAALARG